MVAKIIGVLMVIFGALWALEFVGEALWSVLALVGVLAKLLFAAGIAYVGYRLVTRSWTTSA